MHQITPPITAIHAYVPFNFSKTFDPRRVFFVGDQILLEHILGFHSRENLRLGYASVLSEVEIDRPGRRIIFTPLKNLKFSDGTFLDYQMICRSIEESFSGTFHNPYKQYFKNVSCEKDINHQEKIILQLTAMPANIEFLLTLPDLAIFNPKKLPISAEAHVPTLGPYFLKSQEEDVWELGTNLYYPNHLRKNEMASAFLHSYRKEDPHVFLEKLDPKKHHLVYISGECMNGQHLTSVQKKGYRFQSFPNEWLTYLQINPDMPFSLRQSLVRYIHHRIFPQLEKISVDRTSGNSWFSLAWSIAPSARPFALKESIYKSFDASDFDLLKKKSWVLRVQKNLISIEVFQKFYELLKQDLPQLKLLSLDDLSEDENSKTFDLGFSMIGISEADPIGHLSYLRSAQILVGEPISEKDLAEVATIEDGDRFIRSVYSLEHRIAEKVSMIPLAHYPGYVLEAPFLKRDESLAWSWGFQIWTYDTDWSRY